jgi:hypothetical protein
MNISLKTLEKLRDFITGDTDETPYKKGRDLVRFFNQYGFDDEYQSGFPSRWEYTENNLRELNGSKKLVELIEDFFNPVNFVDTEFDVEEKVEEFNRYLKHDGYKLESRSNSYTVRTIDEEIIEIEEPFLDSGDINEQFVEEQISKCRNKIHEQDYDGAITNARSLLEAILTGIEKRLANNPPEYKGNINSLFTRVRNHLNLDPSRNDISDRLKEILTGLISIVSGMAGLRNKMSDAHVRSYEPDKHHAKLAVNAVNTVCDFLFETYEYQKNKDLIEID